jgi:hypothetical protein
MKKTAIILISLLTVFLSACGSSSGPAGSAEKYYRAIDEGKADAAYAFISSQSKDKYANSATTKAVSERIQKYTIGSWTIKGFNTVEENINGGSASVLLQITYGKDFIDEDHLEMVSEGGNWVIKSSTLFDKLLEQ